MTPRQLHALEWAVDIAEAQCPAGTVKIWDEQVARVRSAVAWAWNEYRAFRIDARTRPPRRALQQVAATVKGE